MPPTGFEETHPPRHYPCEDEKIPMAPTWLSSLRGDIQQLVHQQNQNAFLVEVFICTQTAQQHTAANTTSTTSSEAHGKLHADHEARIAKLEPELADYRSRALFPLHSQRRDTPRSLGGLYLPQHPLSEDALLMTSRLCLGGFRFAKRCDLQAEIRAFFKHQGAPGVLQKVYAPYLRSNIARLTLNYPGHMNTGARRRAQTLVIDD